MALGGKTVQYTLAVDLETGQLTAESKRVAAELNLIKRQTDDTDISMKGLGRGIKDVKQALSLISGAAVFGLISSQMGQLVDFAQQYHGATKEAADELERLGKFLKQSVAESTVFSRIMQGIAFLSKAVVLGRTAGFGAAGETEKRLAAIQTDEQKRILEERKKIDEEILNIQKAINAQSKENVKLDTELRDLAWERSRFFQDEILQDTEPLMNANFQMAEAAMIAHDEILVSQKDNLIDSLEALDAAYEDNSASFRQREIEAHQAWTNEMNGLWQGFFLGIADGFAAMGAAAVNGKNAMSSFGAVFLKSIAQLAIQFGSFLVLYGTGMGFIPGGQTFSAGAIAAGIALTVFGGALGALANKIGGSGSSSRASEREQRFRDSRVGTSGGNGGMTIINNIDFGNTVAWITREVKKEVAESLSEEIFKQAKLGRNSFVAVTA